MKVKIIVSFSGGKDSQACLIWATNKYGNDNIEAVFCDTGWEHPITYKHIHDVCELMGIKLTILKSKFDFVSLAEHKKRFPSVKARFCTEELKIKPMIDHILSLNESCIIIQGIRAKESKSRSMMQEECMYFKGYFIPRENGKKDTYRKKEIIEWCKRYDASIMRPIFKWTAQQVIDYILENEYSPNPLYSMGLTRVGCYPCIMCRHYEVIQLLKDKPMLDRLIEAENKVGSSFFSPGYIPKYACKNRKYPTVSDVVQYLKKKNATPDMFEPEDGYSCMSMYHGLCE